MLQKLRGVDPGFDRKTLMVVEVTGGRLRPPVAVYLPARRASAIDPLVGSERNRSRTHRRVVAVNVLDRAAVEPMEVVARSFNRIDSCAR